MSINLNIPIYYIKLSPLTHQAFLFPGRMHYHFWVSSWQLALPVTAHSCGDNGWQFLHYVFTEVLILNRCNVLGMSSEVLSDEIAQYYFN